MNQIVSTPSLIASVSQSHGDIRGTLSFARPHEAKPVVHSPASNGVEPEQQIELEEHVVSIGDMREIVDTLSIDHEGFELLGHTTSVQDLYDDDAVDSQYLAEIEALLRQRFDAARVVTFDATRRSDDGEGAANRDGRRGPARRVHVDYTGKSGPQRVADILGEDEAKRLAASGARIVQVNVWRPIRGPVQRAPLALADASTVQSDALIATDRVTDNRVGEIYHLAHSPLQRWYYAPRMTRDEVLLIKGWDSLDDGRAKFTPHSAFELSDTDETTPPRESIEVRTFVIIE